MLTRARTIAALATTVVLFGVGAATTVGQIRDRRRARELQWTTLPTPVRVRPWNQRGALNRR
ncbi:MAG: hypothetical protein OEM67_09540 [Thermoleophilia bacterium]|nr:hypothetical protein [Thermoleophilia bacterium]